MTFRILAAFIGALLITGCAGSIQEMREIGPQRVFASAKPEQQVAECILFAWQNQSLAGVHYDVSLLPKAGGGRTVANTGYREIADVQSSDTGSKVEFFSNGGRMTWISDKRVAALQSCL